MRGNHVDADALKELTVGVTTRNDVSSLLGTPTAKGSFDDNTWIYIGEVTQPRIGRVQGVNSQEVVEVTFDQGGVLRSVKHLSQKDSMPVTVVDRTTPSPGSESSFMQQLLGNVGRFNAGPSLGADSSGGAGSSGGTLGNGSGI
jgi:outer membrane protein assembly factor BamE (lipoprotein component of BamABCDE complex)